MDSVQLFNANGVLFFILLRFNRYIFSC